MSATEGYFVTRTVRALELLAFGPASVAQLAAALQIHDRTARRVLARLLDEEYVRRLAEPRRRYTLSLRLVALAAQAVQRAELPILAAPFVEQLHDATGLTAHLVVPSYDCVLCLVHRAAGLEARPALRELVPAHCTAGGKVLLSERRPWRESVLQRPMPACTARTLTDPTSVEREAAATRQRGYAIEDGEYREGMQGVAAAVRDGTGPAIAALAVSGAVPLNVDRVSDTVVHAAADLSAALARDEQAPNRYHR